LQGIDNNKLLLKINLMKKNYLFKTWVLFCVFSLTAMFSAKAQTVNTYGFTSTSGTYTPIAVGTTVLAAGTDDGNSPLTNIGFTFNYGGNNFTQFSVNSNGYIRLGATATTTYTPISAQTNTIAFAGRDGRTNQAVIYELAGTAPNRVLTIQFVQNLTYINANDVVNAQIKLYETSNLVQFVYGATTAATTYTPQVGLRGAAANFSNRTSTTTWATPTAGAVNTATMTWSATVFPASGRTYTWSPPPATPPTPTEVAGSPSCLTGTNIEIATSPVDPNVVWFWQGTNATGIVTTNPTSANYNVMNNGTYYARAYNTVYDVWSSTSSSIAISSIPVAVIPPAPTADINPSCVTTGSQLSSVLTGDANITYYWQTLTNGTSTANTAATDIATTPLTASVSGTYYVSAFDGSNSCWSPTSNIAVVVNTTIPPAPIVATANYNYCSGVSTAPISATVPVAMSNLTCASTATVSGTDNTNPTATVANFSCATGTITSASLNAAFTGSFCGSWYDMDIVVNGVTVAAGVCNQTNFNLTPYLPLTSVSVIANDTDSFGDGITLNLTVNLNYSAPTVPQPSYTLSWFDAATAGNSVGTGSPLETVGTSVMPTAVLGSYPFYAQTELDGCSSATRGLVTVNINDVNADLIPVDATCNGGENGSFTLGTVNCGTQPFLYSIGGGPFSATIPTNLTAGTYSVVIQDDNMLTSAPISVVIAQPAVPSAITFTNVGYFGADVSWVTAGDETSWDIEFGPVGFTPGTGTTETASASPYTITGLQPDTDYDVYITPVCGTSPQSAGPVVLSTNTGFFTYDNSCGPGFNDISSTGVGTNLGDDGQIDFILPFTLAYQGLSITTLSIDNNGGISFVSGAGVPFTNGTMAAAANGLYPLWDDLYSNGGSVYTQVIGTVPNRQAIIQWNVDQIGFDGDDFVFQVVIDEATNEIYFIYDNAVLGNATYDNGATATIGAAGPLTDVQVSFNNATYLQNNSCVHFYNALCPNVAIQSSVVAQEQIDISWNAGAYGEVEWTIIYGPVGFDPSVSGTTVNTMANSISITGLTQLTEYDVYIYSECTADNLTSGGLLVNYTTLPWCNTPTTLAGSAAVDSLFATWNYTEAVGAPQSLTGFNIQYGEYGFGLYNGTTIVADGLNFADTVLTTLLAGGVYEIYVQSVCGTDTSLYAGPITVVAPITNDAVCTPQMLNVDGTVYTFNNTGATAQTGEAALITGSNPGGYNGTILPMMQWGSPAIEGSNWYTFVAPASGSMWFSGEDENFFASQIAIYEATDCSNFSTFDLVAASDQTNAALNTKLAPNFTICGLTPGATYYILHDAWSNGFGGLPVYGQYSIKMTEIVLEAGSYVDVVNACAGATVDLFDGITGYDAGGVWSSTTTNLNQGITGSMFNSAGFAYDQFVFEYKVSEGCAYDTLLTQVEIYAPSSAGVDGTITACRNEPIYLLSGLSGNVDLGGQWYNPSNNPTAVNITTSNFTGSYNYDYIVSNGVCPNDTSNILVTVGTCDYLDLQELVFGDMNVYPNPTDGMVFISSTSTSETFSYELMDVKGQVLSAKTAAINGTSTTEISLEKLEPGVYMIRVYNTEAEKTFRIIKQ
jgi:hypothetical protein